MIKNNCLLGKSCMHIDRHSLEVPVHTDLVSAVGPLKMAAEKAGCNLFIASGFRDYARQLSIWNDKALGRRPIMDVSGEILPVDKLSDEQKMFAILRWSALPGASRHHWGTDIDVYDRKVTDAGYALQLTVAEAEKGGAFESLHRWLDDYLEQDDVAFFRPYATDKGGIAPEPWHLSYAPLSVAFEACLSEKVIYEHVKHSEICLKQVVLKNFEAIFHQFILS